MSDGLQLIVALGNPGADHARDRHNAGFWMADQLARSWRADFRCERKFKSEVAKVSVQGQTLWLQKPLTYMNKSGEAVLPLCSYYKIAPEQILVIHDEMDLPAGTIRFKEHGGHGGHNGLRDIHRVLGPKYRRLRVGIGHPGVKQGVLGHVLSAPSPTEQKLIDEAMLDGEKAIDTYIAQDWNRAAQQLHNRKKTNG